MKNQGHGGSVNHRPTLKLRDCALLRSPSQMQGCPEPQKTVACPLLPCWLSYFFTQSYTFLSAIAFATVVLKTAVLLGSCFLHSESANPKFDSGPPATDCCWIITCSAVERVTTGVIAHPLMTSIAATITAIPVAFIMILSPLLDALLLKNRLIERAFQKA